MAKMDKQMIDTLYKKALEVRENAYVPYSDFRVGAALLTEDGEIYLGANVENASYSLSICAERNAIFKANADGKRKFKALMVVADTERPISPCGACRQVMAEFGDYDVYLANLKGDIKEATSFELLPYNFNKEDMDEK
ncbi:cytidine deaminase [Geotoga petraea]|jgi:cytidine deaminase|uniref:Cytidine deaminase n=3 Tax=Geotoga petraea TaxID=28234 RepID=A0A4Z0W1T5_9BACT|nr:cytidine deaminase [Geotoga petraea]